VTDILTPGIAYTQSRLYPNSIISPFFDLGKNQPPANSLRLPQQAAPGAAPLCLAWSPIAKCPELTFSVDQEYLFSNYLWVTGTSTTAQKYSEFFSELVEKHIPKEAPKLVFEVASNDGTFLKQFQKRNFEVLGIDPAKNIVATANQAGIPSIAEFFNQSLVETRPELKGKAGCVIARNVLPHVNDPRSILSGMASALDQNGIAVIEFHQSGKILEELHYDSIYHEHIFYFSVSTVTQLLSEAGLFPFELSWSPISGGSAVIFASKKPRTVQSALRDHLELEKTSGVLSLEAWKSFAESSSKHAQSLYTLVKEHSTNALMIGYGASARSSTMLNFAGLNSSDLAAIADQSEYKHGRPTSILLLAWNFRDEIINILKQKYSYSGKLIIPLPNNPTIISLN
jgi:SAM-dependent methyltransferase